MFRLVFCIICIVIVLCLCLYAAYCDIKGQPICASCNIEAIEIATGTPQYGMTVIKEGDFFKIMGAQDGWYEIEYNGLRWLVKEENMP